MLFGCFFNSHFVFVSGKHISFLNACAFGFAVIKCGGNQGSSEFLEFVEWTKKALEIIQQPVQPKKTAPSNVGGIDFGSLLS